MGEEGVASPPSPQFSGDATAARATLATLCMAAERLHAWTPSIRPDARTILVCRVVVRCG